MAKKSVKGRVINLIPNYGTVASTTARILEKDNAVVGKVVKWGINDILPHEIITLVKESGTLSRCTDIIDSFIQADGFSDKKAATFKINPTQEADEILDQIAGDASIFTRSFGLKVKYDNGLNPAQVYYVPLQTIRRLDNGQFLVNPTMGTKAYKKDQDQILDAFNPEDKAKIREMFGKVEFDKEGNPIPGSQIGQLFFVHRKTGLTPDYAEPTWLAGREDIESDIHIPKSDQRSIKKNFRPATIVSLEEDIDDENKDENEKTDLDYVEDNIREMLDPDNEGDAVILNYKVKLESFDSKVSLTAMDPKRDVIARAVCRHAGVHPVLIGLTTAGQLGQTQEIINSIQMLQWQVNKTQRAITRAFSRIFPDVDWTISTASPIKYIPQEVLAKMTDDEIRNMYGLPPLSAPITKPEPDENNEG